MRRFFYLPRDSTFPALAGLKLATHVHCSAHAFFGRRVVFGRTSCCGLMRGMRYLPPAYFLH